MQSEDRYELESRARICSGFWTRRGKVWSFQEDGILPRTESSEDSIEAIVMFNDEIYDYEDEDADQVYGTSNRNSRRRLKKALNEMKITEVYSEPRIAKAGKAMGLQQGTSFDIKTGYDFTRLEDRARAWRKLQQEKPDLLVLCPPADHSACCRSGITQGWASRRPCTCWERVWSTLPSPWRCFSGK